METGQLAYILKAPHELSSKYFALLICFTKFLVTNLIVWCNTVSLERTAGDFVTSCIRKLLWGSCSDSSMSSLKCYSQILCEVSSEKSLDFHYFVLIWWQSDKKQEILTQSCKDLFILAEIPIVWLIIGLNNIFSIDVEGACTTTWLCTTRNAKLEEVKILFKLLTWTSTHWCHRKMML